MIGSTYFTLLWTTCSSGFSTVKHCDFVLNSHGWTFLHVFLFTFWALLRFCLAFVFTFMVTCHVEFHHLTKHCRGKNKTPKHLLLFCTHCPLMPSYILYSLGNKQQFLLCLFSWHQVFIEHCCIFIHVPFLNWTMLRLLLADSVQLLWPCLCFLITTSLQGSWQTRASPHIENAGALHYLDTIVILIKICLLSNPNISYF